MHLDLGHTHNTAPSEPDAWISLSAGSLAGLPCTYADAGGEMIGEENVRKKRAKLLSSIYQLLDAALNMTICIGVTQLACVTDDSAQKSTHLCQCRW